MRLTVGSKVSYPAQGPCVIGAIVNKVIAGSAVRFYQLALLDESGADVFIPVDRAATSGLRALLKRSEVPALLERLTQRTLDAKDWKSRFNENLRKLTSGSPFDLAEVIASLSDLSGGKDLTLRESWMLNKARQLLINELAQVLMRSKGIAAQKIDEALQGRPSIRIAS